MKKSDFFYNLPEERIAQTPVEPRDSSRLMRLDKQTGELEHLYFSQLTELLQPGDLLVMNDSRVIPARLFGKKIPTGAAIQFLLLERKGADCWEILVKPGRKAQPGTRFTFGDGLLEGEILEVLEGGNRLARFTWQADSGGFYEVLERIGQMPLPEYIHEKLENRERYQTVYSKELGSAAAPTAGLHFTKELLDGLRQRGVDTAFVTLHVGLGTFRPVKVEEITEHKMHAEHYHLSRETAGKVNQTKRNGGRVVAVGTTSCRTLESAALQLESSVLCEREGDTDIFIYPGYSFRIVDGLITNFHLPESTLIMLVSALAGYEHTMRAYEVAVKEQYRFYSFGDAMLIL